MCVREAGLTPPFCLQIAVADCAVSLMKIAVLSDGLILPVRKIAAVMVAAYERSGFGTGTVRPCRS